ncbi:tetratricopeptide repeat protein [Burkholderia sp. 22PA0099]|uniref:tetratricopeptide repeat protein n=1 Tax=Burkholderia sp. 22PA0099 TaxID=3237372 RepID=UPI0039C11536
MIDQRMKRAAQAAALGMLVACAPGASHAADTLRPDVARPLSAAQDLYRAHKYRDALGKIALAQAVPNKTPYEALTVDEMRGAAAMAAGDAATAEQAYEAVLASDHAGAADEQRTAAALAGLYFQSKRYPQAIRTAQRYQKAGGADPEMRTLLLQSYYLSNDCTPVIATLKPVVEADARAGRATDEASLQMLATCAQRANDGATYLSALESLAVRYPNPAYQSQLFDAIRSRPGYLSSLDLDIYRLRRATGSLSSAGDYMEMTQLAIVAGSTAEGKQVIDQGFVSGALGHDAQADREKRLQALAAKRLLAPPDPANPVDPVDAGLNLVFAGKPADGLAQIRQAIAKGGLAHPDLAQLRLGEAYYVAGDKARAQQAFRALSHGGHDGTAELAGLWGLVAAK